MDAALLAKLQECETEAGAPLHSQQFALYADQHYNTVAELRQQFCIPKINQLPGVDLASVENADDECVYLCGNSLGLQPKGVRAYFDAELTKWAEIGVHGHFEGDLPWAHCDEKLVAGNAAIVGSLQACAQPSEVAMMNGLTVNVHIVLAAFYQPRGKRNKILLEAGAFPSDHYAVESAMRLKSIDPTEAMLCLRPRQGEHCLRTEDILARIDEQADSIAMLWLGGVQYYTGQLFHIATITAHARSKGIVVGWDLAHAAGNVPLRLHDWGVDCACWCSYKYMNTGAGGLSGLFVHDRHANAPAGTRMLGWWAHRFDTRFAMDNVLDLAPGAAGYRISNPPIFLACPMAASLDVFNRTSMPELSRKSYLLTGYLEWLLEHHLGKSSPHGHSHVHCNIISPRDPAQRGAQLTLSFNTDVGTVFARLKTLGVVCDSRHNTVRIAPAPLYNNYSDVWRFVHILQTVLNELHPSQSNK